MGQLSSFNIEEALKDCDAGGMASIYYNPVEKRYMCRCLICARCNKHTGNSNYGHYTRVCRKREYPPSVTTKEFFDLIKDIPHHFCCPDGGCSLEEEAVSQ